MPIVHARYSTGSLRGGAQARLMHCDDGHAYVVKFKNNPQNLRTLVNELIVTRILEHLHIAAPKCALVYTSSRFLFRNKNVFITRRTRKEAVLPGVHFGSRYPGKCYNKLVYDSLPGSLRCHVANLRDYIGAFAVDKWTGNMDKRQSIFFRTLRKSHPGRAKTNETVTLMIDHGFAFNGHNWNFVESPVQGLYPHSDVYSSVTCMDDIEPWLRQIAEFPQEILNQVRRQIPSEWLLDDDAAILDRLLETLFRRRSRIYDLVLQSCESSGRFQNFRTTSCFKVVQ